ncbi:MAG TPA: hypothetical protein VGR62_08540 [Candidatus Binatia bacterium]|jgi:integrase|nr:hypothetical protein [Candidatus Binatia bacterium]
MERDVRIWEQECSDAGGVIARRARENATAARASHPPSARRNAWKKAPIAAGCPWRVPHDFRRTAVRSLELAGVSRSVAMAMTEHKTEAVYRRYAIVAEADLHEAARRLERSAQ